MECETAQEILLDAERGGLPAGERDLTLAREHVGECAGCRAALADFRRYRTVLRDFDASAEPAQGWDAFTERLIASIGEPVSATTNLSAGVARRWAGDAARLNSPAWGERPWWVVSGVAAAAAACMLAGGIGFWAGRQGGASIARTVVQPGATTTFPTTPLAPAALSDADARVAARAFAELRDDQSFGSRTSWVVLTDNAADSAFEPVDADQNVTATSQPSDGKLWVLRLTALRDHQVVSRVDLAMLPGRAPKLRVRIPGSGGETLHYLIGTTPGPSPRATIWTDLEAGGQGVVAMVGKEITLQQGEAISAGRLPAPGGAYDLKVSFAETTFPMRSAGGAPPSSTPPVWGKGIL